MRKLGLIGGTGPQSTMPYYLGIVYGVKERVGKDYFPPLTIESVDVYKVLDYCAREDYDGLVDYFVRAVDNLAAAGAEVAALTANTSHIVYDRLRQMSPVPIVSIIEVVADEAARRGYRRIGLLGTKFTMNGGFYRKPFIDRGIEIVTPEPADMDIVDYRIMSELELGVVKEETRAVLTGIIERMKRDNGIEAVVLGCTELPMILNDAVSPVPCLDTVQIHIDALVDVVMNG